MIPIKLTIEGLYSYQKRQIIDFKKLTSNHLFGIFGTVGSGKSSILEAITFSLYGKTDRLNLSGDNRNYNMMNLKSDQLFIEFDFIAGKDEQDYKVLVQAKRNSKKYNEVKKLDRIAYKKIDNEYKPITTEELEVVIGLSYDNFKRTIIIPQGKFQEFLQLGNAERTRMMKELFNLNKYELFYKVKNIEDKNNANIQNLQGRLEQLGEISNDQYNDFKSKLNGIEKSIQVLSSQQKDNDKIIKEFDKLKEITDKLKKSRAAKDELEKHKEEIQQLEKNLSAFEYCIIHFRSNTDAITQLESKVKNIEIKLNSDKQLLEKNTEEFEIANANLQSLKKEYDQLNTIKKEIEDSSKILDIISSKEVIYNNTSRLNKGKETVIIVTNQVNQLEQSEKDIQEDILQLKSQLPDIEELTAAQQWHQNYRLVINNQNELKREKSDINTQILNLQKKLSDDLKTSILRFSSENKHDWINEIEVHKQKTEEELQLINRQTEKLLIHSGLEETAKTLENGAPCPLCGSEHHPTPLNTKDISLKIKQSKDKIKTYESEIKKYGQLQQTLEKYFAGLEPLENQKKRNKKREISIEKELESIHKKIIAKYSDESMLNKAILQSKDINNNILKAEADYKKTRETLSKAIKDKARYQEELNSIKQVIDKQKHAIEILESQVSEDIIFKYQKLNITQVTEEKKVLEQKVVDVELKYLKTQELVEDTKKKLAEFEGRINANQKHLQEENAALSVQKKQLNEKIEQSPFNNITEIQNALKQHINIEEAKNKINIFSKNLQGIENEIKFLTLEIGDAKYDSEKHTDAKSVALDTTEKLNNSIRIQGELQSVIADIQKKLILKKELTTQLLALQLKGEDISTLKKLFHSSGFVNYISSVYLQNLCSTANERFYKMTRQKLSLELNKDNNFEVRDYMNGGNLRSIKTLSGGQTFQAALSLALALADNIQSMTETNQNFFFLDEGFGSLDKESLDIVFSTLKNLRKENRTVGIISHVEEMQQEIPTYLNIIQNESTGSFIEESWER